MHATQKVSINAALAWLLNGGEPRPSALEA